MHSNIVFAADVNAPQEGPHIADEINDAMARSHMEKRVFQQIQRKLHLDTMGPHAPIGRPGEYDSYFHDPF